MTDRTPTSDHDADLLASLYLDGEATVEEVEHVEASPDLMARVETFRSVSGALGAAAGPPVGLAAQQITAALDAMSATADASATNVVSLANRRSASGVPAWLGVAAGLLVVFGGLGFALSQIQRGSGDDATASESRDAASSGFNQASDTDASATTEGQAAPEAAADMAASDDAADDSAADSAADSAVMEDEAMEESDGGSDDVESPTTTAAVTLADLVPDLGPAADRTALDIAQELLLDPDLQLDPLGDAQCFGSPALKSIAQPTGFVNVLLDGQLVEVVFFEMPETTDPGAPDLRAIVLARGDCAIVLE